MANPELAPEPKDEVTASNGSESSHGFGLCDREIIFSPEQRKKLAEDLAAIVRARVPGPEYYETIVD